MNLPDKIKLGEILIAAMHAEVYGHDLEQGLIEARHDTFIDNEHLDTLDESVKPKYIEFVKRNKTRLIKQALFMANAAMDNIPSINWQPFDPENPPTDTEAEYLVEIKNGDFIHCYMVEDRFYSLCKSIPYYKGEIKAYAIINPSNL